jgi:hypothetical protein
MNCFSDTWGETEESWMTDAQLEYNKDKPKWIDLWINFMFSDTLSDSAPTAFAPCELAASFG